jgi:hypothetical protein
MFQAYDHLQVKVYTSEINLTGFFYAVRFTSVNNINVIMLICYVYISAQDRDRWRTVVNSALNLGVS